MNQIGRNKENNKKKTHVLGGLQSVLTYFASAIVKNMRHLIPSLLVFLK